MAETAAHAWSLRGEYFENCNCKVTCPCLFSTAAPLTSNPTEGACEVAFAFHLDEGTFDDVPLGGLNVAMIARTPGPMIDWTSTRSPPTFRARSAACVVVATTRTGSPCADARSPPPAAMAATSINATNARCSHRISRSSTTTDCIRRTA